MREGAWRPGLERGTRVATYRHYVAIEVIGDHELLEWWPDDADVDLAVVDPGEVALEQVGDYSAPYDYEAELRRHGQSLAREQWTLQYREERGPVALWTFVDLTEDEEDEVERGARDLRAKVEQQRSQIEPIVAAIRGQTERFFADELPSALTQAVEQRRQRVRARQAVADNLSWPDGWKYARPQLERAVQPQPEGSRPAAENALVHVEHRPRLAPASFDDVQRTMRVWADAVERYPRAFSRLPEDRLSDLLAATLNAALPGAQREVYRRTGKSDIFISADVLAEGTGPAKVFVCESKWWGGRAKVNEALDQLLSYLDTKDTAAVLLFFHRLADPNRPRMEALEELVSRSDYRSQTRGATGWPVLTFDTGYGGIVEVCLAMVDLPGLRRTAERQARQAC